MVPLQNMVRCLVGRPAFFESAKWVELLLSFLHNGQDVVADNLTGSHSETSRVLHGNVVEITSSVDQLPLYASSSLLDSFDN